MKNILLIRTSTVKQEVESQKDELLKYVKSRNNQEIVIVGGAGASAIKLDDYYVSNINKVYEIMETGDTVWAWSVDRIGRNEEVLMQFKNRLIKAGVNLCIKEPCLELFDSDGKVNSGIELAFSLFATMSKQEMERKKAQFKRAKKRNREEGKFNGGKVMFGYTVDKDGYFVVEKETASVVEEIFKRYANEPVSCHYLAKDYHTLLNQKNMRFTEIRINRMLKNEAYKGVGYPRIVSDELFDIVQGKLAEYRIKPRFRYKEHPYWCQGLLYEVCDNGDAHRMRVKKSEVAYMSYTESFSISINYFDSMVYEIIKKVIIDYNPSMVLSELEKKNAAIRGRREILSKELEELSLRDEELDRKYFVEGTLKLNYENLKKQINSKRETLKKELSTLVESEVKYDKPDFDMLDEFGVRDVFMKYIDRIFAYKIDKWTSKIDIVTSLGVSIPVIYDRRKYTYRYSFEPDVRKITKIRNIEGRKRT